MPVRIDWLGKQVADRVRDAARIALDETAAAAVTVAQDAAPRDTGFMASTIEAGRVKEDAQGLVIQWGNWTATYTLWQEIGSQGRPGRYFLRRAADAEYPRLAKRIVENLK